MTNPHKWKKFLKDLNPTAALFTNSYQNVYNKMYTEEHAQELICMHDSAQDQVKE